MSAAPADQQVATAGDAPSAAPGPPGFGARGRVRRRARFLRKARELAYRDLGGLVFNLHRFGQRNDALVLAKLATLSRIDAELRALEASLSERQPITVLREAGITACPRCAAIHSGEDRFCPNCGLSLSRRSDLPIAGASAGAPAGAPAVAAPSAFAASAPGAATPPGAPAPAPLAPTPPGPSPSSGVPSGGTPPPPPPPAAAGPAPAPARAPAPPATQTHATVGSASGARAPSPSTPAPGDDDDQPTEIVRPPARGS